MASSKNALALVLFLLIAGSNIFAQTSAKKTLTLGRMEDTTYLNDYFSLKLGVPSDWVVQTKEFNNDLKERGKDVLKEGSGMEEIADLAMSRTFVLLTISKYEIGLVDYNPTLVLVAERVDDVPSITKGSQYLDHSKKFLRQSKLPYQIEEGYTQHEFGGRNFYLMKTKVPVNEENSLIQRYYSTIDKGFALSFIVSYSENNETEELAEMEKIIKNIKFSPASE